MISFGNIKEEPITDLWHETASQFRAPGRHCYANVISETVARADSQLRPLSPADSRAVVTEHPPYDPRRLPRFYRAMGTRVRPDPGPSAALQKPREG